MLNLFLNQSSLLLKLENGLLKKKICQKLGLTKGNIQSVYILAAATDAFCRFLLNMTAFPEMVRNVAVVGHLHHGKTALMDMLVFETHKLVWDSDKPVSHLLGRRIGFLLNSSSFAIQTHTSCRESVKYRSNRLQCPLSFPIQRENPI